MMKNTQTMKIELPKGVSFILQELSKAGHEAYAVGGCVRDSVLKRVPGDWDITTSAMPEEVKGIFKKTVDTGIEHGTVTVILREQAEGETAYRLNGYEVTTYRIDGDYKDGRHPETVSFTPSLEEDLKRRDFTINAMAYNDSRGLVDLFGGMEDMKARCIRCVGDPDARFDEDALRILRAVRFAAQLDFDIEEKTKAAIKRHAENLSKVSKERILTELTKLICSPHAEETALLFELQMEPYIAEHFSKVTPEYLQIIRQTAAKDAAERAGSAQTAPAEAETGKEKQDGWQRYATKEQEQQIVLEKAGYDLNKEAPFSERYLRYAYLCHGMHGKDVASLLRELKADNDTVKHASLLAEQCLKYIKAERYEVKKVMQLMTPKLFADLLMLKKCCRETPVYRELCYGEDIDRVIALFEDIMRKNEPVYMKDLVVKGADLIRVGIKAGPVMGDILNGMLEDVLHEPTHNSVLYLLSKHVTRS